MQVVYVKSISAQFSVELALSTKSVTGEKQENSSEEHGMQWMDYMNFYDNYMAYLLDSIASNALC